MRKYRIYGFMAAVLCIFLLTACGLPGAPDQTPHPTDYDMTTSAPSIPQADADDVQVFFINVGKADAALIRSSKGDYLIDTGSKDSTPQLLGALRLMNVSELTGVFLTHTHSDHIGGMEALAQNYPIKTVYFSEISEPNKDGENKLEKLSKKLSLNYKKLAAGDTVGDFEMLGPLAYNDKDDNDNSLILKYRENGKTVLFTGDMQTEEEDTLFAAGEDLTADILKVANHGNPDATSDQFVRAVSPSVAVISTDTAVDTDTANPRVLQALKQAEVHITQDYDCGVLVRISTEGKTSVYDPHRPPNAARLFITGIDKDAQTVTIQNDGALLDLSGYMIFSERGSELFVFPPSSLIAQGRSITITCEGGEGDYIWPDKKVWATKKSDAGVLYDPYGAEIDRHK